MNAIHTIVRLRAIELPLIPFRVALTKLTGKAPNLAPHKIVEHAPICGGLNIERKIGIRARGGTARTAPASAGTRTRTKTRTRTRNRTRTRIVAGSTLDRATRVTGGNGIRSNGPGTALGEVEAVDGSTGASGARAHAVRHGKSSQIWNLETLWFHLMARLKRIHSSLTVALLYTVFQPTYGTYIDDSGL